MNLINNLIKKNTSKTGYVQLFEDQKNIAEIMAFDTVLPQKL